MMYLDGGALSFQQKAYLIGVFVVSGAAIDAAIFFGSLWTVAKIAGYAIKTVVRRHTAATIAGFIASFVGGYGIVHQIINLALL